MKKKIISDVITNINSEYIEKAADYTVAKKSRKPVWMKWGAIAACFAVCLIAAFSVLPNMQPQAPEVQISMSNIYLNDLDQVGSGAAKWYDPEAYDYVEWNSETMTTYYGKDLTPTYTPNDMNTKIGGLSIAEKSGTIVSDAALIYYFYKPETGGIPVMTVTASKLGELGDCTYLEPDDKIEVSDIEGAKVTFGQCPAESGNFYVAEFDCGGVKFQVTAEQVELEEVIKVVSSIITGASDITVNE